MPDWSEMFVPDIAIAEVIGRASIMYLFLVFGTRFLLKRQGGAVNLADLLVVVAIVDGAQPAFSGDAQSITESVVFILTIMFWAWALNWLSYRFEPLKFLTAAPPLILFANGKFNRANMRQALMTREEFDQQLREEGVEDLDIVHRVTLEGDGEISVVKKEDA